MDGKKIFKEVNNKLLLVLFFVVIVLLLGAGVYYWLVIAKNANEEIPVDNPPEIIENVTENSKTSIKDIELNGKTYKLNIKYYYKENSSNIVSYYVTLTFDNKKVVSDLKFYETYSENKDEVLSRIVNDDMFLNNDYALETKYVKDIANDKSYLVVIIHTATEVLPMLDDVFVLNEVGEILYNSNYDVYDAIYIDKDHVPTYSINDAGIFYYELNNSAGSGSGVLSFRKVEIQNGVTIKTLINSYNLPQDNIEFGQ